VHPIDTTSSGRGDNDGALATPGLWTLTAEGIGAPH
jgi:hypothetical protein